MDIEVSNIINSLIYVVVAIGGTTTVVWWFKGLKKIDYVIIGLSLVWLSFPVIFPVFQTGDGLALDIIPFLVYLIAFEVIYILCRVVMPKKTPKAETKF